MIMKSADTALLSLAKHVKGVIVVRISERELLMSYLMNQLSRYEDEERELLARIRYVKCDALDCMELMITKEKVVMFREFASNVIHILKLNDNKK